MLPTTPYIDETNAQVYFDERLDTGAWDDAITAEREKALAMATRQIDRLNFVGEQTLSTQENQFPRGGDTTVPEDIQIATCEIAIALLDDAHLELDYESQNMTSQTYGRVRAVYKKDFDSHILAGIPSIVAWRLLTPYLRSNESVLLTRVS